MWELLLSTFWICEWMNGMGCLLWWKIREMKWYSRNYGNQLESTLLLDNTSFYLSLHMTFFWPYWYTQLYHFIKRILNVSQLWLLRILFTKKKQWENTTGRYVLGIKVHWGLKWATNLISCLLSCRILPRSPRWKANN